MKSQKLASDQTSLKLNMNVGVLLAFYIIGGLTDDKICPNMLYGRLT